MTDAERSTSMRRADMTNGEGVEEDLVGAGGAEHPTVLIAVDDTDRSIGIASVARRVFGEDARYFVVNVGSATEAFWGGTAEPLPVGAAFPILPSGGYPVGVPFVRMTTTPDSADYGVSDIDAAQQTAQRVADEAHLHAAEPVGDIGDPVDRITTLAAERDVDVVVVGAHQGSWLSRLFSPSVADGVVKSADRAVLVVP